MKNKSKIFLSKNKTSARQQKRKAAKDNKLIKKKKYMNDAK